MIAALITSDCPYPDAAQAFSILAIRAASTLTLNWMSIFLLLTMGLDLNAFRRPDRLAIRAIFVGVEKVQARNAESLFDGYGHAGGPFKLTIHVVVGSPQAAPRCLGHLFGGDMYFHAKFVGHFASKFKE